MKEHPQQNTETPTGAASRAESANSTVGLEGARKVAIAGEGRSRLALAAVLAMAMSSLPVVTVGKRKEVDWWGDRNEPINTGRRAEKDAAALEKAEAKRQRKAEKQRMRMKTSNV